MKKLDARSLAQEAKEALRKRAVLAVLSGLRQNHVARTLGVSAYAVNLWMKAYRTAGEAGLTARKKGPPNGYGWRIFSRRMWFMCR